MPNHVHDALLHTMPDFELSRVRTERERRRILTAIPPHPVQTSRHATTHRYFGNALAPTHGQMHVPTSPVRVDARVTHLAMEPTGVYWKRVWNLFEGYFELLLVNAQHMKQVPGRKTDIRDCEWIADLLQHGLLRGSYVPQ